MRWLQLLILWLELVVALYDGNIYTTLTTQMPELTTRIVNCSE